MDTGERLRKGLEEKALDHILHGLKIQGVKKVALMLGDADENAKIRCLSLGFRFTGHEICYDIVYQPRITKFLSDAQEAGCSIHTGLEMLIGQGKLQFEAFTGYHYPRSVKIDLS